MRSRAVLALLAVVLAALAACGRDEGTPQQPAKRTPGARPRTAKPLPEVPLVADVKRAEGVVVAFLEAAAAADEAAMRAHGTARFVETQKAEGAAFTALVAKGTWKVKSFRLTPAIGDGDDATVPVQAVLEVEGKDGERRLLFHALRRTDRWWIDAIE